jgi:predicted permease
MGDMVAALTPILALILVGFGLKRAGFLPTDAWSGIEKLTYFILLPCLLVHTLGAQSLVGIPWPAMLLVVSGTLMAAVSVLIVWHQIRSSVSGPTFTSIFQGGVRFNTYISLAVAQAFFGADGLAMGTVAAGFMIVLINLLCISAFALWGAAAIRGLKPFVGAVIGNPLILACALGWALSLSGIGLPGVSGNILEILGRAALPFGLLAVGAALQPEAIRSHIKPAAIASIVQFGLKPLVAAVLVSSTGLTGVPAAALAISLVAPTAPSAYILARQLGGDAAAMASIITFQTLLAFLVMPIIVLRILE